ncbi:MAG: class I SAM-dependent methyltransferase [Actinomycetota bacterium]|nr:class I SAM-dependent methyltransferase [Actinomycetota bacterium]
MIDREGWIQVLSCGVCGSADSKKVSQVRDIDVVRCDSCGTVRITAVRDPSLVYADGYHLGETWGDELDGTFDYTAPENIAYERHCCTLRLQWLEKFTEPGRLIDVGGGVGTFAQVAKERGWDPTVVEPVPSAIDFVKGLGLKGIVAGIDDLSPAGSNFDVLSLIHVIEHFTDVTDALTKAKSAVKPGGFIFMELPHWDSIPRRVSGDNWVGWRPGQHIHLFTKQTLAKAFEMAGLETVSIKSVVLLWDGLIPDYYAYLVGGTAVFNRLIGFSRKVRRAAPESAGGEIKEEMPPSLKDQPFKRTLLKPPIDIAARIEEWLGVGENLRAIARVPG